MNGLTVLNRRRRPPLAVILSFFGGLLILGAGTGMPAIKSLALSGNLPQPLQGLITLSYTMMVRIGFAYGLPYAAGVISGVVPGIIMIICAVMMYLEPAKATKPAYLIIAFAFVSLIGVGGFLIGAIFGIVGGALVVLRKRSTPKITPKPPPRRPVLREEPTPAQAIALWLPGGLAMPFCGIIL
jgi:hypothetical protein